MLHEKEFCERSGEYFLSLIKNSSFSENFDLPQTLFSTIFDISKQPKENMVTKEKVDKIMTLIGGM